MISIKKEVEIVFTGWQRFSVSVIVLWTILVIGTAVIEREINKGTFKDGAFTCWQPNSPKPPQAPLISRRNCSILPEMASKNGLFDDVPYTASSSVIEFNTSRILVMIFGPIFIVWSSFKGYRWVYQGFKPDILPSSSTASVISSDRAIKIESNKLKITGLPSSELIWRWTNRSTILSGILAILLISFTLSYKYYDRNELRFYLSFSGGLISLFLQSLFLMIVVKLWILTKTNIIIRFILIPLSVITFIILYAILKELISHVLVNIYINSLS